MYNLMNCMHTFVYGLINHVMQFIMFFIFIILKYELNIIMSFVINNCNTFLVY